MSKSRYRTEKEDKRRVQCPFEVNRGNSRYPCPVCGSNRANFAGSADPHDIYQCDECGHIYRV